MSVKRRIFLLIILLLIIYETHFITPLLYQETIQYPIEELPTDITHHFYRIYPRRILTRLTSFKGGYIIINASSIGKPFNFGRFNIYIIREDHIQSFMDPHLYDYGTIIAPCPLWSSFCSVRVKTNATNPAIGATCDGPQSGCPMTFSYKRSYL
jgi:hypothetical protein